MEKNRPKKKNPPKISIVGGAGRMGVGIARILKEYGMIVTLCDKREDAVMEAAQKLGVYWEPMDKACNASDIVVVCVTMKNMIETCQKIGTRMREGSILVEISSVKSGIADTLSQTLPEQIGYVSLHPLFGPDTPSFEGQNIIAIKTRSEEHTERIARFLRKKGAEVTILSVKDHDYAMAVFQVVHHFSMLSLARSIDALIPDKLMKRELITRSLKSTLGSELVILGNLPAVMEIQKVNPFAEEVRRSFVEEVGKMLEEDPDVLYQNLRKTGTRISTLI
jgi:prephenate dehydrogenase